MRRYLLVLLFFLCSPAHAQDAAAPGAANEKALKYHEALLKRPQPGFLFDRFYNAWLDGDSLEAMQHFLEARVKSSATTADQLLLAFYFAKQSEDVKALEQFRVALEKDPGNADIYHQKAQVEARTLDFNTALADLEKALAAKPTSELRMEIQQLQGKLLARSGQNEKAVEVWKKLTDERPQDEELQEDLLELQMTEAMYDTAQSTAEALIAKTRDPYKWIQRTLRLGDVHQRAGRRDKAVETYGQCLAKVGSDSWLEKEVLSQIDQVFRQEDNIEGLKAFYAKLIAAEPKRITVRRAYAKVLASQKEADAALKEFAAILALTPGEREVRDSYIETLIALEKKPEAIAQLKELIKLNPNDRELPLKLADLQAFAEQPKECQATALAWLEQSDKSEGAFHRVLSLLERNKLEEAALQVLEKLITTHPQSTSALEAYAAGLHALGKKDEAVAAWKKLAGNPDKAQAVAAARAAAARNEHQTAFEILKAREKDFGEDASLLSQLCTEAILVGKEQEALPLSHRLVLLTKDASQLDAALALYLKIVEKADQTTAVTKELTDRATTLTAQEKCILAELMDRGGKPKEAEQLLKTLESDEPELAAILQVRLHTGRNDWKAAAAAMEAFVTTPAGRKAGYVQRLIDLHERSSDLAAALKWIPEWKKLAPGAAQPWLKESSLLQDLGKPDDAARVLRAATQQFGEDDNVRAKLAEACTEAGKLADAERLVFQLYDEAKDSPSKIRWAGALAEIAANAGKTEELVEKFEERRRGNRGSIIPLLSLAEIYRATGDSQNRRKMLMDATRLKPSDPELMLEIARIDELDGNMEQAQATLKSVLALDKSGEARFRLARMYLEDGKQAQANALLSETGGTPLDARKAEDLANSMAASGDWKGTLEFLLPHSQNNPEDYRLDYLMGVACEEDQQPQAALAHFLNVLKTTKELKSSKHSTIRFNAQPDEWTQAKSSLPPDVIQVFDAMEASSAAYSYQQSQNYYYSRSRLVPRVAMPLDLAEARKFAFAHLLKIAGTMEDAEREIVGEELVRAGFRNGKAIVAIGPTMGERDSSTVQAYLDEHPANEFLNTMLVMTSFYTNSGHAESLAKASEGLATARPELALMGYLKAAGLAPERQEEWFGKALDVAEKMEKPTPLAVMGLAFSLSQEEGVLDNLPAELKQRLSRRLATWFAESKPTDSCREMLFSLLSGTFRRAGDYAAWVKLLEDEAAIPPASPGATYYYGGNVLQAISLPLNSLPNFPNYVLGALSGDGEYDSFALDDADMDKDKLKPAVESCKNLIVKFCLTLVSQDEELSSKVADEMAALPSPSVDQLLLAAAWKAGHGDRESAIETLRRAQQMPITKTIRMQIDSSIAAWALELLEEGSTEADSAPVLAARESVLRLRRSFLTADERNKLAQAMEKLGMTREAEAFDKSGAALAGGSGTSGPNYNYTTAPTAGERLIQLGKKSEGMLSFLTDIRKEAKALVPITLKPPVAATTAGPYGSFQSSYSNDYSLAIQPVLILGLEMELLKMAEPGSDADAQKLAEFAAICEFFNLFDKASEYYKKSLTQKADYHSVRMRLFRLVVRKDLGAGFALLKELPPERITEAIQPISRTLSPSLSFADQLKLADLTVELAEHCCAMQKPNLSWTFVATALLGPAKLNSDSYVLSTRGMQSYDSAVSAAGDHFWCEPNLLSYPGPLKRDHFSDLNSEQFDEISRRHETRRTAYIAMCRKLLALKTIPPWVFDHLQKIIQASAESKTELAEAALKVATVSAAGGTEISGQYPFYVQINQNDPPTYGYLRLLLETAIAEPQSEIASRTLAILDKGKTLPLAREFRVRMELASCPSEQFWEKAGVLTKLPGARGNPYQLSEVRTFIVSIAVRRNIEAGMKDWVVSELMRLAKEPSNEDANVEFFLDYAKFVSNKTGREAVTTLLGELAEKFLGPKDKRAAELKRIGKSGAPAVFFSIVIALICSPDWGFSLLPVYEEEMLRHLPAESNQDSELYLPSLLSNHPLRYKPFYAPDNMANWEKVLKDSPLLAPSASFRLLGSSHANNSLFDSASDILENLGPSGAPFLAWLGSQPATLGRDLLLCAGQGDKLIGVTARYLPELKALPTERQKELRAQLASDTSYFAEQPWESPEVRAARDWIHLSSEAEVIKNTEKIMGLKSARDALSKKVSLGDFATQTLQELRDLDEAKAEALYSKLKTLYAEAEKADLVSDLDIYAHNGNSAGELLISAAASDYPRRGQAGQKQYAQRLNFAGRMMALDNNPLGSAFPDENALFDLVSSCPGLSGQGSALGLLRLFEDKIHPEHYPLYLPSLLAVAMDTPNPDKPWLEQRQARIASLNSALKEGRLKKVAPLLLPWLQASAKKSTVAQPANVPVKDLVPDQLAIYDYLNSEHIPFSLRLGAMHFAIGRELFLDVPVLKLCADIELKALADPNFSATDRDCVFLQKFSKIADPELWKSHAPSLGTAFKKRYPLISSYLTTQSVLQFYGRLGDAQALSSIVRNRNDSGYLETWTTLIEFKQFEPATRLLIERHEFFFYHVSADWTPRIDLLSKKNPPELEPGLAAERLGEFYTKELELVVPEYLARITHEDTRVLARTLLANMPDSTKPGHEPECKREQRLLALSKELPNLKFKQYRQRELVVSLLAKTKCSAEAIASELKGAIDHLPYVHLLREDDARRKKVDLACQELRLRLNAGEVDAFSEAVASFAHVESIPDYFSTNLCEAAAQAMVVDGHTWPIEQTRALASKFRDMLNSDAVPKQEAASPLLAALLVSAADHDEVTSITEWWASLPEPRRTRLGKLDQTNWFTGTVLSLPGVTKEQAHALLVSLANPLYADLPLGRRSISFVPWETLLGQEDLAATAKAILEKHGRNPKVASVLFGLISDPETKFLTGQAAFDTIAPDFHILSGEGVLLYANAQLSRGKLAEAEKLITQWRADTKTPPFSGFYSTGWYFVWGQTVACLTNRKLYASGKENEAFTEVMTWEADYYSVPEEVFALASFAAQTDGAKSSDYAVLARALHKLLNAEAPDTMRDFIVKHLPAGPDALTQEIVTRSFAGWWEKFPEHFRKHLLPQ